MSQNPLAFVFQLAALACFLVAGMNWQIPKEKPKRWEWFGVGLWLASAMVAGSIGLWFHQASH